MAPKAPELNEAGFLFTLELVPSNAARQDSGYGSPNCAGAKGNVNIDELRTPCKWTQSRWRQTPERHKALGAGRSEPSVTYLAAPGGQSVGRGGC